MNGTNLSESAKNLSEVFQKLQEIAAQSADGNFIYRGEPKHYEKVSSSLWRECRKELKSEDFDIETIQNKMLEVSKNYTHEKDEFEILTELQHFGGYTNLIDFTTDNHIALFFACDGHRGEPSRIVLLEITQEIKDSIKPPRNPQNRIIAQKVYSSGRRRALLNQNSSQKSTSPNRSRERC